MKYFVKHYLSIRKIKDILLFLIVLFFIITIALNPAKYSKCAYYGIEVWAKILVPSLLPFFILTKIFSSSGIIYDISNLFSRLNSKAYRCPPIISYVFFMSIITGYPVGSKLISDLYNDKIISAGNAQKALSFCSNSGPMFIVGSVACGMINNKSVGIIIIVSHIVGSLINGLLYRNIKDENLINQPSLYNQQKKSFSMAVNESVSSILLIGGVVCFCFCLIEIIVSNSIYLKFISNMGEFGVIFTAIFSGLLEITRGCLMISELNLSIKLITILCTFIISFGGLSTIMQSMSFTGNIISLKKFVIMKLTHSIIATIICLILICLLM